MQSNLVIVPYGFEEDRFDNQSNSTIILSSSLVLCLIYHLSYPFNANFLCTFKTSAFNVSVILDAEPNNRFQSFFERAFSQTLPF